MRRRPPPGRVGEILGGLMDQGGKVTLPDLVRAIVTETNISRASAYRAARDAIQAGVIGLEESGETETPQAS